jgi:hypothetical protein
MSSRHPAPAYVAELLVSTAFARDRFCGRSKAIGPSVTEHFTVVTAPLGFVELASVDGCTAGNHGPIGD